mmetsp:Transcript_18456/g.37259  ORF Transcript_18456/g.37259 Transcript_18456/m.37259 type:complete len:95 (-) Transcript_18456:627-911(-)
MCVLLRMCSVRGCVFLRIQTPLMLSMMKEHPGGATLLLESKADTNQSASEKLEGGSQDIRPGIMATMTRVQAVHCAVVVRDLEGLKILLDAGVP